MKNRFAIEMLWKEYKYEVMWHNQNSYNLIREMMKEEVEYNEIRDAILDALMIQPSKGSVINTFCHLWGYFKKICTESEKEQFKRLHNQYLVGQVTERKLIFFIYCMSQFYNIHYLKESSLIKNFTPYDTCEEGLF
ncbi:DUF1722 domain-containing protein [Mammaliicoccus stepanovicii]|uniref:Type II DNA modification enzyme n=1 Tax=Mammaliicoccus stepanovicii TaxID=643214 RepID=A0A239Y7B3_9STAP|nr:DUF1722 domain-containing protein [Mammaliicoccus stepanovicii]GGI43353.1 hypothetical protein GCM10010896_23000 [Mammaliicoccus stepanovicii]SNV54276.1 type II DNA modification enzyme [Mammaliicoccus stepanovicii]